MKCFPVHKNRQNAAKIAGLKKIPAIIKYDLPDTDAYVYVIETNLMQRSFSDLEISEKAAVLKERYDKVLYQRQRESIMAEGGKAGRQTVGKVVTVTIILIIVMKLEKSTVCPEAP